jgi:hypothetical protein
MADLGASGDVLDVFLEGDTGQMPVIIQASGADVLQDTPSYTYVLNNSEIVEGVATTRHFLPW